MKKKTTQKKHRIASWLMALGIGVGAAAGVGGMVACAPGETNVPDNQQTYTQQMEDLQDKIDDLEQQITDLQDENSQQKQALQSQVNKLRLQYAYANTFTNYAGIYVNSDGEYKAYECCAPNGEYTAETQNTENKMRLASYNGILFFNTDYNTELAVLQKDSQYVVNNYICDYSKTISKQIASSEQVVFEGNCYICSESKNDNNMVISLNSDGNFIDHVRYGSTTLDIVETTQTRYESINNENAKYLKSYNQYVSFANKMDEFSQNSYFTIDTDTTTKDGKVNITGGISNNSAFEKCVDGEERYTISDSSGTRLLSDNELDVSNNIATKNEFFSYYKTPLSNNNVNVIHINIRYNENTDEYVFSSYGLLDTNTYTYKFEDGKLTIKEKFEDANFKGEHNYQKSITISQTTKAEYNRLFNEVNDVIEDFISAQKGNSL